MADNRASRDTESRTQFQRPQSWRAPEILPMPDPRPGWTHRYIRIAMMGKDDPQNISSKLREGWEPVKADEYPELMVMASQSGQFKRQYRSRWIVALQDSRGVYETAGCLLQLAKQSSNGIGRQHIHEKQ